MDWNKREVRQQFYHSKEWRKLRKIKLSIDPLCEKCLTKGIIKEASVVDHKVDIILRPELRLTLSNLQSLCVECHNKKSSTDNLKPKSLIWKNTENSKDTQTME